MCAVHTTICLSYTIAMNFKYGKNRNYDVLGAIFWKFRTARSNLEPCEL